MSGIILGLLVGALLSGVLFYFLNTRKEDHGEAVAQKFNEIDRRFDEKTSMILTQLNDRLRENRESIERSSGHVGKNLTDFATNIAGVAEKMKFMDASLKQISTFQEIFRSPKLRGQWGEAALANLLSQYFPKEHYELQYHFRSTNDIVDSVLKLPDGRLLPIDSKFPLENFEKDRKLFLSDVKSQVDSIAAKYILPAEGTVDMALMYIPAEAVYYEIIRGDAAEEFDLPHYARTKRVIPVSPNTFYLTIQTITHWYRDIQVSKEAQEIWKRVGKILQDSKKLEESFSKLDVHLSHARSAFDDSNKRLGLMGQRMERLTTSSEEEVKS